MAETSAEWAQEAIETVAQVDYRTMGTLGVLNDATIAQAKAAISVALAYQEAAQKPPMRQIGWIHPFSVDQVEPWDGVHGHEDLDGRSIHNECRPVYVEDR